MGCTASGSTVSGAKRDVDASMQLVKANPVKGLPMLQDALDGMTAKKKQRAEDESSPKRHSAYSTANFSIEEKLAAKTEEVNPSKKVPQVFELLPKAIARLSPQDWKAVVAVCAVIEGCVALAKRAAKSRSALTISVDSDHTKSCICELQTLLRKVVDRSAQTYKERALEDETCSTDAKAIAKAIQALFTLQDHKAGCRHAFTKSGMNGAVDCMKTDSGLNFEAKFELVNMFFALLEFKVESAHVQAFIACHGTNVLLPYCDDPKKYGAPLQLQLACMEVLDTCIRNGQGIANAADVNLAIQKTLGIPVTRRVLYHELDFGHDHMQAIQKIKMSCCACDEKFDEVGKVTKEIPSCDLKDLDWSTS